jgi:substrate import-associated zinc metallohydrolase lipoprotein
MKKVIYLALLIMTMGLVACSEDDKISSTTIFPTTPPERDAFDIWLQKNYTATYNIDVKYKMEDIESDMTYQLVPADSSKSAKIAILIKYLWFDAYNEAVGQNFVKANVPRIIHFIGSSAYNSNGTETVGTAEGGLKVTLYKINDIDESRIQTDAYYHRLNEYYFHTMHHEFTHILHQKVPYDTNFKLISEANYRSTDWYLYSTAQAQRLGFITNYAMSQPDDDFAELMSTYITSSKSEWESDMATAGTSGADIINQKLEILRKYMQESWGLDIDLLRDIIQRRASEMKTLDLEHLN